MFYNDLKKYILDGNADEFLKSTICFDDVSKERERYLSLLERAYNLFGDGDYHFVSSPGRTEVGGNHTDHQHGHCLTAALNIDDVCVYKKNDTNTVNYYYDDEERHVDLSDLSKHDDEHESSTSLIRGIAYKIKEMGYDIGGIDGVCDAKVLVGSGISSSACFEVMLAEMFNYLYCEGKISDVDRAIIGRFAEREYFGKGSGLMDQATISVGGFVSFDFFDDQKPVIKNYEFSFEDYNHDLVLVNVKGSHAGLSNEYSAVPGEIRDVAHELGVDYLADTNYENLVSNIPAIREKIDNDRGILRSIHFFRENKRAIEEADAVKEKDINKLLKLMKGSGHSSFMYLQNVYPASRPQSQPLALALALTAEFLGDEGAYRVHGGGFGGTIQVILPKEKKEDYKKLMEPIFGDDSLVFVKVRSFGTKTLF